MVFHVRESRSAYFIIWNSSYAPRYAAGYFAVGFTSGMREAG